MADIRPVTATFAVAPQIAPGDLAALKQDGYVLVINNRPDHEQPGQPTSAQFEEAATAAGLSYVHIPVVGLATPHQVAAMAEAVAGQGGKVLAFCRSGTRSITAWSLGRLAAGQDRDEVVSTAAAAGYDLSGLPG